MGSNTINRYVVVEKQIKFDDESTSAYAVPALAHLIDQTSEDISQEHGFVYPETSAQRNTRSRLYGPRMASGEIACPFYTKGVPTLVYYALGEATSTQVDLTGVYTHVIKSANTIPCFRMGVGKDAKEHKFVGCAVKSMKIDYSLTESALCTFDLLVRKELTPNTTLKPGVGDVPDLPDYNELERSFLGSSVNVTYGTIGVTPPLITNFGKVRSFSLEVSNDIVEDNHTFGSRELPALIVQGLTVTGSLSLTFEDITEYQNALEERINTLKLAFTHGSVGTLRSVTIDLNNLSIDTQKLPTDSNKEFVLELEFTAQNTTTGGKDPVVITIQNAETNAQVIT